MKEYSLFWIKPDVFLPLQSRDEYDQLKKDLPINPYDFIDDIKIRLKDNVLEIIEEKECIITEDIARIHYAEHEWKWSELHKEFQLDFLIRFMTSWKSYWIVFYGDDAIKKWREILVDIRDKYLVDRKKARLNMTHASDSFESANREIMLHFPEFKNTIID